MRVPPHEVLDQGAADALPVAGGADHDILDVADVFGVGVRPGWTEECSRTISVFPNRLAP